MHSINIVWKQYSIERQQNDHDGENAETNKETLFDLSVGDCNTSFVTRLRHVRSLVSDTPQRPVDRYDTIVESSYRNSSYRKKGG